MSKAIKIFIAFTIALTIITYSLFFYIEPIYVPYIDKMVKQSTFYTVKKIDLRPKSLEKFYDEHKWFETELSRIVINPNDKWESDLGIYRQNLLNPTVEAHIWDDTSSGVIVKGLAQGRTECLVFRFSRDPEKNLRLSQKGNNGTTHRIAGALANQCNLNTDNKIILARASLTDFIYHSIFRCLGSCTIYDSIFIQTQYNNESQLIEALKVKIQEEEKKIYSIDRPVSDISLNSLTYAVSKTICFTRFRYEDPVSGPSSLLSEFSCSNPASGLDIAPISSLPETLGLR